MKIGLKNKFKKVYLIITFIILLIVVIDRVAFLVEDKYSYSKYYDFYHEEENIDVLFLGTSHVINAIYPMELWRNYGIVSYNLSNYSETICINYWQLVNALQYTKPKLVVIDLFAHGWEEMVNSKHLHHFTDAMPFSITKMKAVCDLMPQGERAEYMLGFSLYHSRWEELLQEDFEPDIGCEKGAELRKGRDYLDMPQLIPKEQYKELYTVNAIYLQKMIDLCKDNNIQILLTHIPFASASQEQMEEANYGYVVAQNNDINYLNLLYEEDLINYTTDNSDKDHLNASGARKITDYIGQYIVENYDVSDRRNDSHYAGWNEDWLEYEQYKYRCIVNETDLFNYLVFLADKNIEVEVYLSEESLVYQDYLVTSMLDNLESLSILSYQIQKDIYQTGDIIFCVKDSKTGNIINYKHFVRIDSNLYEIKAES